MSDKEYAEKWRLRQAEELLRLFEEDTGSPAKTNEELTAWRSSARGKCVIERPYLFPSGTESFKRSRKKLNEAIAAFADWGSRMAAKTEKVSEK
jgi:hypothetical protein